MTGDEKNPFFLSQTIFSKKYYVFGFKRKGLIRPALEDTLNITLIVLFKFKGLTTPTIMNQNIFFSNPIYRKKS